MLEKVTNAVEGALGGLDARPVMADDVPLVPAFGIVGDVADQSGEAALIPSRNTKAAPVESLDLDAFVIGGIDLDLHLVRSSVDAEHMRTGMGVNNFFAD